MESPTYQWILVEVLVLLLLIGINGLLAMTELAVVSSRKGRLQWLVSQKHPGSEAALALAESPERLLSVVQIGITLVGLFAGIFSGATLAQPLAVALAGVPYVGEYAEALSMGLVVVVLTFLSLILGELVPKQIALRSPESMACWVAKPLRALIGASGPIIWLLEKTSRGILKTLRIPPASRTSVTEEEVRWLMQEGSASGIFHPTEPRMVESVMALDQRPVTDIMTPRGKVVFVQIHDSPERIWHKIVVSGHSHYPVYDQTRDLIIGVLSVKSVYANGFVGTKTSAGNLMEPPLLIPAKETLAVLLETFQRTGHHIGMIVDEQGRFLGLVTLVDVLEAIVGQKDSMAERTTPAARQTSDGSWIVDAHFPFRDLVPLLGLKPEAVASVGGIEPWHSVADVLTHLSTPGPREGTTLAQWGRQFEVLDMDGDRIDKVRVSVVVSTPANPSQLQSHV